MPASVRALTVAALLLAGCSRPAAPQPVVTAEAEQPIAPVACSEHDDPVCAACKSGEGEACLALAMDSSNGEKHLAITERACELAFAPACTHLGMLLMIPAARSAHREELVSAACTKGDAPTCIVIAHRYATLNAGTDAQRYFERACTLSPSNACLPLYRYLANIPDADFPARTPDELIDYPRAKLVLETACDAQDASACLTRGDIDHRFGNDAVAASWDDKACGVSAVGCFEAAEAYADGGRRPKSPRRAQAFYLTACEREHAPACEALANVFDSGPGFRRDPRRAQQLHERACRLDPKTAGCTAP